jgi:hypothetical protein
MDLFGALIFGLFFWHGAKTIGKRLKEHEHKNEKV